MFQYDQKLSFRNAAKALMPADIAKAEYFWILEAQKSMRQDLESRKSKRICPRIRSEGVIVVGGLVER